HVPFRTPAGREVRAAQIAPALCRARPDGARVCSGDRHRHRLNSQVARSFFLKSATFIDHDSYQLFTGTGHSDGYTAFAMTEHTYDNAVDFTSSTARRRCPTAKVATVFGTH
ncbi:MAG: hypothetical protein ACJAVR_003148, partial [Paracoccaceae bacterium]